MQILSIALKNIKSHRDTELHFSPGINVLSGPNGVGKSTIFEAIGYALFGVDAQSFVGNVERFISIGAKRGEIAVEFQLNDEARFRVSRSVGTPAKWLLAKELGGGFEVEEHKDAKETEARLKELLGLDNGRPLADQFTLVIGPFQHEFLGPFVIKQAAKRRDEFDAILGIDTWRKTFGETNGLLKAIKARIDALESAIAPLREQLAVLPEKREAQQTAKQELTAAKQQFKLKQQTLDTLEKQLQDIDQREQRVKTLGGLIDTLRVRIETGREKIAAQKALVGEAEKAQQTVNETAAGRLAFEQAEQHLAQLAEQAKRQRQLEGEVALLDKEVGRLAERFESETRSLEGARQELGEETRRLAERRQQLAIDPALQQRAARLPEIRQAIDSLRAQAGQLQGRRAGLAEGSEKLAQGICPFFQEPCRNLAEAPPGDVFSAKFADLDAQSRQLAAELTRMSAEEAAAIKASDQLKTVAGQLKVLEEQAASLAKKAQINEERGAGLAGLQKDRVQLQQQLATRQQELQPFSTLQADIAAAEAQRKQHQPARDLYLANQRQAGELAQRRGELQKFETFLQALQGDLAARETELKLAAASYSAEQHQTLRLQKDGLGREVGALEEKVAGLGKELERLAAELDQLKRIEQLIAAKQAEVKAYTAKEELVKFLRNRVFRNVSGYLSERFREEISRRADRIYRTIAESDEELLWAENYQVVLRDLVDGNLRERSDDQLSGGQMMSAVVALRLALLQTIGARIAFFDEPTSNLDAARRENLARAFRAIDVGREEVTEHWYDQLFLVSHDVAFTEITDQIIELGK
jgi:DNA repair protein SbcC/Rad50